MLKLQRLTEQIEEKRKVLIEASLQYSLVDPKVVAISQELDVLLDLWYQHKLQIEKND